MTMSFIAPNLAEPGRRQGVAGRCRGHRQWWPKLPLKRSGNEPERFCRTFGQTAELAAQAGDMHVSWVSFPSDTEEQCSPHRFVTPALHATHHHQTITAAVPPPAGLALLSPLAYHHEYPGMRQIVLIGSARDWKSALPQMQIEQRPMLPVFERIHFSDSHLCDQIANKEA